MRLLLNLKLSKDIELIDDNEDNSLSPISIEISDSEF